MTNKLFAFKHTFNRLQNSTEEKLKRKDKQDQGMDMTKTGDKEERKMLVYCGNNSAKVLTHSPCRLITHTYTYISTQMCMHANYQAERKLKQAP